jgi:hypothetical protein
MIFNEALEQMMAGERVRREAWDEGRTMTCTGRAATKPHVAADGKTTTRNPGRFDVTEADGTVAVWHTTIAELNATDWVVAQ